MRSSSFFVLAWSLAMCGCGGGVAASPTADGGSTLTPAAFDGSVMATASATTASDSSVEVEPDAGALSTGACTWILASNYDQSCMVDSDCLSVWSGYYCAPSCECANAAISSSAISQYTADTNATGSDSGIPVCSGCPAQAPPCCRQGICEAFGDCSSPLDTLAACADAGGECVYDPTPTVLALDGIESNDAGPPSSCAYADETCVIVYSRSVEGSPCPCPP